MQVRNTGRRTCVIHGRPLLTIPAESSAPITVSAGAFALAPGYPATAPPFGLRPGQTAGATVLETFVCDGAREERRKVRVAFSLPSMSGAGAGVDIWVCRSGATLSISPLSPPERPEPKPRRWPLRASLAVRGPAVAGDRLDYLVTLENVSREPFRFPYCPPWNAGIDGAKGRAGVLNCKPVGSLEPGEEVTFEMRHELVPHLAPGRHELTWSLEQIEFLDDRISATAELDIERK